jgi:hypothetical protein
MPKANDVSTIAIADAIAAMTPEEHAELFRSISPEIMRGVAVSLTNTAPAIEEGPHLQDPEIREVKRRAMVDAGLTPESDDITDDMREILREKG